MSTGREQGFLRWQWDHYERVHTQRLTLVVHLLTVPLFLCGTLALLTAPFVGWPNAVAGLVTILLVVIAQGRTHAREPNRPEPFLGPHDVVARLFAEQWVTFPRFVWSGRFADAWRKAGHFSGGGSAGSE